MIQQGRKIGDNGVHDGANHYLTEFATGQLNRLGYNYAQMFTSPELVTPAKLHINDASLPWGGLFDASGAWDRPHNRHRRGSVVDIRANGCPGSIPDHMFAAFQNAAILAGGSARFHANHYHVRLKGGEE